MIFFILSLFMPPPEVVRVLDAKVVNGQVVQSFKYVIVFPLKDRP